MEVGQCWICTSFTWYYSNSCYNPPPTPIVAFLFMYNHSVYPPLDIVLVWLCWTKTLFWWHSPRNRCQIHCTWCIECCLVCASCFSNDNTTERIAYFFCPLSSFHRRVSFSQEGEQQYLCRWPERRRGEASYSQPLSDFSRGFRVLSRDHGQYWESWLCQTNPHSGLSLTSGQINFQWRNDAKKYLFNLKQNWVYIKYLVSC